MDVSLYEALYNGISPDFLRYSVINDDQYDIDNTDDYEKLINNKYLCCSVYYKEYVCILLDDIHKIINEVFEK